MQLPEEDQDFLKERGYDWVLSKDGAQGAFLIIRNFDVSKGGFEPPKTDLMIRIPDQYNMAPLDMWYCDPPIRLGSTGQFASASESVEQYLGRSWQRFSRHFASGAWRPGIDNIRSFMHHIFHELQGS